jgi:serine/threonine-protein kinase
VFKNLPGSSQYGRFFCRPIQENLEIHVKSFVKYALIFLAAMAGAAGIAYYSIGLFTQSAAEIVVPKLTGKNIIYVLETLTNMGLNAKLYGTRYDDAVPLYAVLSQDPQPGTTIKKGRDVIIYISRGKKENIVPDLRQISPEPGRDSSGGKRV